ncbi:carbohydrate-binding domain-containing protein [Fontibacillus sp. BL9]|uniref:carbohydrate-binding domain-containing protein n=1 Tax=Fontibacillus sp. BL9 TaxID=3389971 RepID=UPI00397DFDF7
MKNSYNVKAAAFLLLSALLASGCSTTTLAGSTADSAGSSIDVNTMTTGTENAANVQLASLKLDDLVKYDEHDTNADWSTDNATSITMSGSAATVSGSGAKAQGGTVTISAAGTYVLSGKLDEGSIVVDAGDGDIVHLVLNGAQIHNSGSSAIVVKSADKTILTLAEGTDNEVSDGKTYAVSEEELTAAIYSKDDLTINGTGKLSVQGNYKDGIASKDDLKIVSGTLEVTAADDGILGRDVAAIKEGGITIKAGGDGIKTTNDTETDKGNLVIEGGTFNIESGNDGLQSAASMLIEGGNFSVVTGGGSANAAPHQEKQMQRPGFGAGGQAESGSSETATANTDTAQSDTATVVESESTSAKGLKATAAISINNGTLSIDSADDAVHSNGSLDIAGGDLRLATGDDALHADASIAISGGTVDITESYEGIEGADIAVSGGEIHVVASDDGVNATEGSDTTSTEAGGRGPGVAGNAKLAISGGFITVNAAGDGLDSNGAITMSGGTAIVNGPTNSGNGSLDYDGTFEQTGGVLVAAGSSGMAQAPSESSSQRSVLMTFPGTLEAGTLVTLADSKGVPMLSFTPEKSMQSIVISAPELKSGETYAIYTGGTSTGQAKNGLVEGGKLEGGTKIVSFTLGEAVTYVNESGVTTGGGGFGGSGGGRGQGGGGPRGGQGMKAPSGNEAPGQSGTTGQSDATGQNEATSSMASTETGSSI